MTEPLFEVVPYSHQSLIKLLTAGARTAPESWERRIHGVYFKEYFGFLETKTVVAENNYVDQHFLDDYTAYYVGCFHGYERMCRRLHFFNIKFSPEEFTELIEKRRGKLSEEKLQKAYLGFVVVKPLPTTLLGRTCLKTYAGTERHYPITKTYKANLFGISLSIDTIAFQEQDTVTAACATSALWSALHCTGETFHHEIPSPHEITSAAKRGSGSLSRIFPNKGLTFPEMAQAVRAVGLEPLVLGGGKDQYTLSSTLYAYLNAKIPVVLGLELFENGGKSVGWHAITITGFRLPDSRPRSSSASVFKLRADRINKIYAHDDQVGPFARMSFMKGKKKGQPQFYLSTSYGGVGTHYAVGENMLVPLDNNIRIPFATISDTVIRFDQLLRDWANLTPSAKKLGNLEWDILLSSVNDFKSDIFSSSATTPSVRKNILFRNLPKFVWRAKARIGKKLVLELVFDSTDIEQGRLLLSIVEFDQSVSAGIRELAAFIFSDSQFAARMAELRTGPIFEHFRP